MTGPDTDGELGHDEPFDEIDMLILGDLRQVYAAADPVPAGLVERSRFALDLSAMEAEVLRLLADDRTGVGTRASESARTITFDCPSLTVMITVSPAAAGDDLRIDGWLAPAGGGQLELATSGGVLRTAADRTGRFLFELVRPGRVQLVVHVPRAGGGPDLNMTTPAVVL